MKIKSFQQFNESNSSNLGLDINQEMKIKDKVNSKIELMTDSELNMVFYELEKMSHKLNCNIEDLTDSVFVKDNLYNLVNSSIFESFLGNIKDMILKLLAKFFEWGVFIINLITVVCFSIEGSFWGVFVSSICLLISGLASVYIHNKLN